MTPQPRPRRRSAAALAFALLCWLLISAAGCPSKKDTEPVAPPNDAGPAQAPKPDAGATEAPSGGDKEGITQHEAAPGSKEIKDVGPPAPTVYFLAGLKGYTEPCGCTLDILLGGIDRVAGYLDAARPMAKGSLLLDAGNTLFDMPKLETRAIPQEKAKVEVILQGLVEMGIASTTPGPNDFALGRHYYLDKVRGAGLEILVANLKEEGGLPLGVSHQLHDLEGFKVGVLGLVQPDLFVGVEGLVVSDTVPAARESVKALQAGGAQVILAVVHGDLKHSKMLLREVPEINFAIVGHDPRETDQADPVEGNYTLEAYDQGRYLGALKLYPQGQATPKTWANANTASKADLDRVNERIEQVQEQISRMPPATPGQEPAFLTRLRQQLKDLEAERTQLKAAKLEIPADKPSFFYRTVGIEPGYPLKDSLTQARESYNQNLQKLIEANPDPIPPVTQGQAEYVGSQECATCHPQAAEVWKTTVHSHAIQTLIERNKAFDRGCVGCHVTGYQQPGGSVAGKLEYPVTLAGRTFTKKLENVGCESCHGPGSLHILEPVDKAEKPQHIQRQVKADTCMGCHNQEHSPRFNYDQYLPRILGKGHASK